MEICKSLNISIGTVVENPEKLKLVADHLKTKNIHKDALKKITLSIKICC